MKQKMIALEIGVHPFTISRELNRNIAKRGRTVCFLLPRIPSVKRTSVISVSLSDQVCPFYEVTIGKWLDHKKRSPELIGVEAIRTGKCRMSTDSLHQWIWQSKHNNKHADKAFMISPDLRVDIVMRNLNNMGVNFVQQCHKPFFHLTPEQLFALDMHK